MTPRPANHSRDSCDPIGVVPTDNAIVFNSITKVCISYDDDDDYVRTYCFMAKGAKVLKYPSSESSEDESDESMIRLQRIYNFSLFHAIILSVLDV